MGSIITVRKIHEIKCWPEYFYAVRFGYKTFEVRKDDRDYQVGDGVSLFEFDPDMGVYTGESLDRLIMYKLDGGDFGIEKGYCVFGLGQLPEGTVLNSKIFE